MTMTTDQVRSILYGVHTSPYPLHLWNVLKWKSLPLKSWMKGRTSKGTQNNNEEVKKLGSSPPSCTHKCYGCVPCEAIQVPTTKGRVGVQYANYEPEGWKCKCGPTLYTPWPAQTKKKKIKTVNPFCGLNRRIPFPWWWSAFIKFIHLMFV